MREPNAPRPTEDEAERAHAVAAAAIAWSLYDDAVENGHDPDDLTDACREEQWGSWGESLAESAEALLTD